MPEIQCKWCSVWSCPSFGRASCHTSAGEENWGSNACPLYCIYLTPVNVSLNVPGVAGETWNVSLSPASQVTALAS